MENYFEIGKITGTHGIRGTMRVFPTTQDPTRFERLKEITVEIRGKQELFHIQKVAVLTQYNARSQKVAYQKNMILLTVKEINDINVAELYKNGRILIPDAVAIPLEEDEYYTRDLYGMQVVTDEGEALGELVKIYETGANDVYAVKKDGDAKELLLPAIKDCILKVDIDARVMTVHLLEGLR
jgi:16S rRNA processing protein RimM